MKESWLQKHSVCVFVCVCPLGVCVTIVYRGGSRIDGRGVLVRLASHGLRAQALQLGGSGGMPPQENFGFQEF